MKKIVKTVSATALSALSLLSMATIVLADAQTINIQPKGQFAGLTDITFGAVVSGLITLALVMAALVAFAFLVYGGIVWITSGGDKAKMESARGTITSALVGLLIVFGAWAIIQLLEVFFGITLLQLNLEPWAGTGT